MKEFFTIDDLSTITMLSARTLRNYIAQGFLAGEKINGAWRFTSEDIEALLNEDFVRQSVQSKNNGIVYDYLLNEAKDESSICSIYDYTDMDPNEAEIICNRMLYLINTNNYGTIKFSYSYKKKKKLFVLY